MWCWRRLFGSPLDWKEIKPVNPKGNQSWIFIGRTDSEVEALILWPSDVMSWLIGKDPDAGKDWRQEERGMTKDEMFGWHHQLNRQEFEQILGDGEGRKPGINGIAKSWTWMNINKSFVYFSHQAQFLFLLCTLLILLTAYFLSVY